MRSIELKRRKAQADAVGNLSPGQIGEKESGEDAQSPKERAFLLQCDVHDVGSPKFSWAGGPQNRRSEVRPLQDADVNPALQTADLKAGATKARN